MEITPEGHELRKKLVAAHARLRAHPPQATLRDVAQLLVDNDRVGGVSWAGEHAVHAVLLDRLGK